MKMGDSVVIVPSVGAVVFHIPEPLIRSSQHCASSSLQPELIGRKAMYFQSVSSMLCGAGEVGVLNGSSVLVGRLGWRAASVGVGEAGRVASGWVAVASGAGEVGVAADSSTCKADSCLGDQRLLDANGDVGLSK